MSLILNGTTIRLLLLVRQKAPPKRSILDVAAVLDPPLITSIFRRVCLQTRLMYNFRFPVWNKINDRHSSKIPDQELYS